MGDGQLDVAALVDRAAAQRVAAAHNRAAAAADRKAAAEDRALAAAELAMEGFDHLTGTLQRKVGLAAVQREMDRSRRGDKPLVLAFVDVDGLKRTNDEQGHAAGDQLLRHVASSIQRTLRSYDVVARFGGDEFVCALIGDIASVRARFEQIALTLSRATNGSTITVGFAEMRSGDSLESLLARADEAMLAQRTGGRAISEDLRTGGDRRRGVRAGVDNGGQRRSVRTSE